MNKKTILTLFVCLLVNNASATTIDEALSIVNPVPSDGRLGKVHPDLKPVDNYKAEGSGAYIDGKYIEYKGRNSNITSFKSHEPVENGVSLSKNINSVESKSRSQFENLETASGEMVTKIEEDRLGKSKSYDKKVEKTREVLTDTYIITKQIKLENLGKEQDPFVKAPFKCADLDNCRSSKKDKHEMKQCTSGEMLHWTGSYWKCIGLFEDAKAPDCTADQYKVTLNGGVACINYVYQWGISSWSECKHDNTQQAIYSCYKKKKAEDKGFVVSDDHCLFLGSKPSTYRLCK